MITRINTNLLEPYGSTLVAYGYQLFAFVDMEQIVEGVDNVHAYHFKLGNN